MKSRIGVIAITGFALLLLGTTAIAGELGGTESIRAKNTSVNTVQLGSRTYDVEGNTVIRDARGNQIDLAALMVPDLAEDSAQPLVSNLEGTFVAEREGSRLVLRSLNLRPTAR